MIIPAAPAPETSGKIENPEIKSGGLQCVKLGLKNEQ